MKDTVVIIPARFASTRFPGKALFPILGKPLVQHVWERCVKAKTIARVIIATDDKRIAEAARDFGAEVAITSVKHTTGSDRIAEVASKLKNVENIINVQGDEPDIDPKLIDRLTRALQRDESLDMVTASNAIKDPAQGSNPNICKVVTDLKGRALYFSRSPIPFDRDGTASKPLQRHIGIYGYRRSFLMKYVKWKPTYLEETEKLEQLRALEHGAVIQVLETEYVSVGVDTPADVAAAEWVLAGNR